MIEMDVKAEYQRVREEHNMGPHQTGVIEDIILLDFFRAGVVRGINHALISITDTISKAEII